MADEAKDRIQPGSAADLPVEVFRRRLKHYREKQRLSQVRLAARIEELGGFIHPTAITRIERGLRDVNVNEMTWIALALGVAPAALLLPDPHETNSVALAPKRVVTYWSAASWYISRYNPPELEPAGGAPEYFDSVKGFYEMAIYTESLNEAFVALNRSVAATKAELEFDPDEASEDEDPRMTLQQIQRRVKLTERDVEFAMDKLYRALVDLRNAGIVPPVLAADIAGQLERRHQILPGGVQVAGRDGPEPDARTPEGAVASLIREADREARDDG